MHTHTRTVVFKVYEISATDNKKWEGNLRKVWGMSRRTKQRVRDTSSGGPSALQGKWENVAVRLSDWEHSCSVSTVQCWLHNSTGLCPWLFPQLPDC